MSDFSAYISSPDASPIERDALERILRRYPWFSAAHCVASHLSGTPTTTGALLQDVRGASSLDECEVDVELLTEVTSGEIIDRFLRLDDYRIVAEDAGEEENITVEAELDDEYDLVTEELAEVYLAQWLKMQAVEIYRKLSLLNPEKSIYFAEKIENVEKTIKI